MFMLYTGIKVFLERACHLTQIFQCLSLSCRERKNPWDSPWGTWRSQSCIVSDLEALSLFHTPPALLFFLFPESCIRASASDFVLIFPVFFASNVLLPDYLHGLLSHSFRFLFKFHLFGEVLPDNSIKTLTSYCTLVRTPYPSYSALALFVALTHHLTHSVFHFIIASPFFHHWR